MAHKATGCSRAAYLQGPQAPHLVDIGRCPLRDELAEVLSVVGDVPANLRRQTMGRAVPLVAQT